MSFDAGEAGNGASRGLVSLTPPHAPIARDVERPPLNLFVVDDAGDRELNLLDYVSIALKWRWLLAGAAVVGIAAGVVSTLLTTPLYEATATIQIDRELAKISPVQTDEVPDYYDSTEFYQTQYALLKSQALAQRVVEDQNLASDAAFLNQTKGGPVSAAAPTPATEAARKKRADEATGIVMSGLHIDPVRGSRLVRISYESPNPAIAAKIANAAATSFIAANLEHRYEASNYARRFLEDRLEQTRQKLEESERQLVAYAAQNQIVNLDVEEQTANGTATGQTSLQATDLASVNQALATATTARIQAEQRWRQAEQTPDLTTLPEVQSDASIQAAIAARATAQAEYRQNRSTMKPDHPTMLALQAKIDQETREVEARAQSVRLSLKNQYDVAQRQEQSLAAEVNHDKGQVLDLRTRSIQYNILQREVDTNKTLYDGLLQRYKEIGVAGGVGTNNVSVVDSAQAPGGPFKPVLSRNVALFGGGAVALAALIAFLLERLDVSIKSPDDIEKKLGMPLLGAIPKSPKSLRVADAIADPRSAISEAHYSVRTALNFSTPDGVPQTLLVTSARPGEGKSTTSLVLASSFARVGMRVLIVDGDMRDPSLHTGLGLENGVGLSNILSGGMNPGAAIQATDQEGLSFLACGPRPPNPAELLGGPKLRTFLDWAKAARYLVIIDGPPILGLADAPLLAQAADGALVVVEAGVTKRDLARMAVHRLRVVRARGVGVVLSKFDTKKAGSSYGHAYGTDYAYAYGAEAPRRSRLLGMPIGPTRLPRRKAG